MVGAVPLVTASADGVRPEFVRVEPLILDQGFEGVADIVVNHGVAVCFAQQSRSGLRRWVPLNDHLDEGVECAKGIVLSLLRRRPLWAAPALGVGQCIIHSVGGLVFFLSLALSLSLSLSLREREREREGARADGEHQIYGGCGEELCRFTTST